MASKSKREISTDQQTAEPQLTVEDGIKRIIDLADRRAALAFPRISRQIMMSKLKRSHANGANQICRRVQVRGGQASYR